MKKLSFTIPELAFIVATRAALAAGVAFILSRRLKPATRRAVGIALASLGGITTIPAGRLVLGKKAHRFSWVR